MKANRIRSRGEGESHQGQKWIGQDLKALHTTNLRALLSTIWESNPISRSALAEATGLAPSSVTRLLQELSELGLVQEIGKGESSGGRQPGLVVPNPDAGLVISLDLSGPHLRGGIFDAANNLVSVFDQPFEGFGPEAIKNQVLRLIHLLINHPSAQSHPLLGIGVSQPGQIDADRGVIRKAANLRLQNFPLRQILLDEFHLPVYIEHDASVAALAEQYYGAGRGLDYFVYVLVSTGIGSGTILDGRIYRGQTGLTGEFGHIIVEPEGTLCVCGKRGCLEAMASGPAILMSARWLVMHGQSETLANLCGQEPDRLTIDLVAQAAQQGDAIAQDILARAADYIALGLNNYASLFGIRHMIIGGEVAEVGEVFLAPLRRALACYDSHQLDLEIIPAQLKQNNFLRGIGMLTLQQILRLQVQHGR
jgi:N-acetylglucosamine repressor